MRTTIDLDEDVLRAVQDRARREGSSAGRVASELLRAELTRRRGEDDGPRSPVTGLRLLPRRGGIVTNDLVNRIRDEEGV